MIAQLDGITPGHQGVQPLFAGVDWTKLAAPFPKGEVGMVPKGGIRADTQNREQGTALGAPYIDAAAVSRRLDDVLGPDRWSFTIVPHVITEDRVVVEGCLSIDVDGEGRWVAKSDVGQGIKANARDESASPFKAAVSDALKRAAAMWGIGRYLRHERPTWLPCRIRYDRREPDKPRFNGWIERPREERPVRQRDESERGSAGQGGANGQQQRGPAQAGPQNGASRAGAVAPAPSGQGDRVGRPSGSTAASAAAPAAAPARAQPAAAAPVRAEGPPGAPSADQRKAIERLTFLLGEEAIIPPTEADAGALVLTLQARWDEQRRKDQLVRPTQR